MLARRFVSGCLLALLFHATPGSSAEKPVSEPNEDAAAPAVDFSDEDISRFSIGELFAQAERLAPLARSIGTAEKEDGSERFGAIFAELLKRADDRQLDRVVTIYGRLKARSFAKSFLLPSLAGRLIQRETKLLRAEQRTIVLPKPSAEISEKLKSAPPDLVTAWRFYASAKSLYEKEFSEPGPKEKIDAGWNDESFYKLIDAAVRGETNLEAELRRYAWTGANCLNVTDVEDAQDIANLLMLLRERRLDLAVAAAVFVTATEGSTSSPEHLAEAVTEFLRTTGVDWESLFIGAEVDRSLKGFAPWDGRQPLVEALGAYGTDRVGTLLNQLARFVPPEGRKPFVEIFETIIERSPDAKEMENDGFSFRAERMKPEGRPPFSQGVQRLSLATVERFATADSDDEVAKDAANIFARTQAASSIPALQELTRHSSPEVVTLAARVLTAMGQPAPDLPTGDVAFQVLVNGQPLPSGAVIAWRVGQKNGSATSSTTEVTADGVVKLRRDLFRTGINPATEVQLSGSFVGGGTQFEISAPPPANPETVSQVNVQASPLEIVLRNQNQLNAPFSGRAEIEIRPHRSAGEERFFSYGISDSNEVAASPSIVLPSIQHGTWDVTVAVDGAEIWNGVAEVGPGARALVASLRPGSDLRFAVINAEGEQLTFGWEILLAGKRIQLRPDYDTSVYHHLACGEYVLHIPGNEKMPHAAGELVRPDRDIPFTISAGSPAVVDLGEIRLGQKRP